MTLPFVNNNRLQMDMKLSQEEEEGDNSWLPSEWTLKVENLILPFQCEEK